MPVAGLPDAVMGATQPIGERSVSPLVDHGRENAPVSNPDNEPPVGQPESADDPFAPKSEARRFELARSLIDEVGKTLSLPGRAIGEVAGVIPAWRRHTAGEPRWAVTAGIGVAITLQLLLPHHYVVPPFWLFPGLGAVLVLGLLFANPRHIDRRTPALRASSIALIVTMSLANAGSAIRLIVALVEGTTTENPTELLLCGGAIWAVNIIVFALWYWELDRGGPADRANAVRPYPDLLFPQMTSPELAPPDWEPFFFDYVYMSFTNAAAFSPTDVLPMARWAKLTMMIQSIVSLATVVLVIARVINIIPNRGV